MVFAIFLLNVLVGLGEVLEVDVDIRHRDAIRIEETLEQELVANRIEIGDFEAIGNDRSSSGSSARADHASHSP